MTQEPTTKISTDLSPKPNISPTNIISTSKSSETNQKSISSSTQSSNTLQSKSNSLLSSKPQPSNFISPDLGSISGSSNGGVITVRPDLNVKMKDTTKNPLSSYYGQEVTDPYLPDVSGQYYYTFIVSV
jgi:hypothetical protein